jgi:hypothetical protein
MKKTANSWPVFEGIGSHQKWFFDSKNEMKLDLEAHSFLQSGIAGYLEKLNNHVPALLVRKMMIPSSRVPLGIFLLVS